MNFDNKCYRLLSKIPKGRISSYKEIARALNTRAYRAVGSAMSRNPNPIIVPCHRVIRGDGGLGGFSAPGGNKTKKKILNLEGLKI